MVWALYQSLMTGRYHPIGDYVGWEDAIEAYYDNDMSDAEKRALKMEDGVNSWTFSRKFTEDFGPLKDAECVKAIKLDKTPRSLGALFMVANRLLCVEETIKLAIEELEPDVHQFWPMRFTLPRDKPLPGTYFGLRIGRFLDSFCPEKSDEGSFVLRTLYFGNHDGKIDAQGLAFSKAKIAGAHLWRERKLRSPDIFLSDALEAKIAALGVDIPPLRQVREVYMAGARKGSEGDAT